MASWTSRRCRSCLSSNPVRRESHGLLGYCAVGLASLAGAWLFAALADGPGFALPGRLTFFACAKKVSKETHPFIRPCALRRVRSLHRCSEGRRTRSIPGPLSRWRPALKRPSRPLAPLRNDSVRPPGRGIWCSLNICAKETKRRNLLTTNKVQATRSMGPVRRPSEGVVEGGERPGWPREA